MDTAQKSAVISHNQDKAASLFNNIPWATPNTTTPAWHKLGVPCHVDSNALQTLDIFIPRSNASPDDPPQSADYRGNWLILIHGGAWRDPLVTSLNFALPTVRHLVGSSSSENHIAGIASLSYSLSPHPSHPLPPTATKAEAASRTATHPQHILDVLSGLRFLRAVFGEDVERRGVLVGHSCGATLAMQAVLGGEEYWTRSASIPHTSADGSSVLSHLASLREEGQVQGWRPIALVCLAGLYDLPALVSPQGPFADYAPIYREFVTGAFGDDEDVWTQVSLACLRFEPEGWEGRLIVLADSKDDGMVPPEQGDIMAERLRGQREGSKRAPFVRTEMQGQHDRIWEDGKQVADVCRDVLGWVKASGEEGFEAVEYVRDGEGIVPLSSPGKQREKT